MRKFYKKHKKTLFLGPFWTIVAQIIAKMNFPRKNSNLFRYSNYLSSCKKIRKKLMTHSWGNTELIDGQTDSWTDRQWRFNRTLHKKGVQYSDMVTRLFTFTVTTYSQKWKFHLHALKDDMWFCTSIYCINYPPLSAVYTADMKPLERNDMAKWDCFMEGNICSQKNDIPWYPMATAGSKTKYWKDKAGCPVNQATQATQIVTS